jgi:outer-membrane receptor for ferric coprogen and ferric-rhodotorulic acid
MMNSDAGVATAKVIGLRLLAYGALFATALVASAAAQPQQPSGTLTASTALYDVVIPAQPLANAISRLASIAHVQLLYASDNTATGYSKPVQGRYTVAHALDIMLEGTGLTYRFTDATTATIAKATSGTRVLGPVKVEGVGQTAGANGSTDVTATEGTGSYTTELVTVGSKMPLSIQQTPQSVSVITQQRIQDQALTDVYSILDQMTGISLNHYNNNFTQDITSRGFSLTTYQFDGGAPFDIGSISPLYDSAEFDHAEVIRGSDGMFISAGTPSGSLNLVRKRPLDHEQVTAEVDAGSWHNYRATVDATGPLAFDGAVRGRVVATYQDQDYFYQTASSRHYLLYGILEGDVSPTTLLTVGGHFGRTDDVPWNVGLPRYANGVSLNLPTSTCLCFSWNYQDFSDMELFARLEQRIGENWNIKLNLTELEQTNDYLFGQFIGDVNPYTPDAAHVGFYQFGGHGTNRQYMADFNVNGNFELFGRQHQVLVGADFQDEINQGPETFNSTSVTVNYFNFNQAAFPRPSPPLVFDSLPGGPKQYGFYSTLRLQLLDPLHLLIGGRLAGYYSSSAYTFPEGDGTLAPVTTGHVANHDDVVPYAGVVYDLTKIWSAYASFTTIFDSQVGDLEGPPPGTQITPQRGKEFEAGFKGKMFDGRLTSALSYYQILEENTAVQDTNYPLYPDGCCYLPIGTIQSKGVDAEVSGEVLPGLQIQAGYTYNQNRYLYNPHEFVAGLHSPNISLAPKHLVKVWSNYQLPGALQQFSVGAGLQAQSSTYTFFVVPTSYPDGVPTGSMPYHVTQGSYAIANGRVGYKLNEHWSAQVYVNNMFNKFYYQTPGITDENNWYGTPRNFMFTIRGSY